ncbi:MOSC domain-containing protein [Jatrophihabitans fulvus]
MRGPRAVSGPRVRSLNVALDLRDVPYKDRPTGIGKVPTVAPVVVQDPGPKRGGSGSGITVDRVGDQRHHGGSDQALYAFAREVLDEWEQRLDRTIPDGGFGENLTTAEVAVDDALLGEQWRIGPEVVVQVTLPRIPCNTFRGWMGIRGWARRFTEDGRSGAYLRVVTPGIIRYGDEVEVLARPDHDITVSLAFRAVMGDKRLLPRLFEAGPYLVHDLRKTALRG